MPRTIGNPSALRRMRDAMDEGKGMSAQDVADAVAKLLGEESRTGASISQIETRGTSDIYVIAALASIYGRTVEEIASAANPENNSNKLLQIA